MEFHIAYGEDFIDDEDLGLEEGGYGEAEADGHAGGETLDGGVEVTLYACEVNYLVEFPRYLMARHAHDAAVHVDVLTGCHLGVETGADLKEGGDASAVADVARAGGGDVAEEFQEGALSGSVLAYDAYHVALLYLEGDVLQRPDVVGVSLCGAVVGLAYLEIGVFLAEDAGLPPAVEVVAQRACADTPQAVLLAYVVEFYCNIFIHALVCFVTLITQIYLLSALDSLSVESEICVG